MQSAVCPQQLNSTGRSLRAPPHPSHLAAEAQAAAAGGGRQLPHSLSQGAQSPRRLPQTLTQHRPVNAEVISLLVGLNRPTLGPCRGHLLAYMLTALLKHACMIWASPTASSCTVEAGPFICSTSERSGHVTRQDTGVCRTQTSQMTRCHSIFLHLGGITSRATAGLHRCVFVGTNGSQLAAAWVSSCCCQLHKQDQTAGLVFHLQHTSYIQ